MLSIRTHLKYNETVSLKAKGQKKICHASINQKKAWVAILIEEKVDPNKRKITKDREGPYIMIKGTLYQQDIAILNMYAPNNRATKCVKQKL